MRRETWALIVSSVCLFVLLAGCSIGTGATPTPAPATQTSVAVTATQAAIPTDMLTYRTTSYTAMVSLTKSVPNTQIRYANKQSDLFELNINGFAAFVRSGDTISWRGLVAPSLYTSYQLIVSPGSEIDMFTQGSVDIVVFNPVPVELFNLPLLNNPGTFTGLQLQYVVPIGQRIPGTTMVYQGTSNGEVQFSGTSQYPISSVGNSLNWLGQLGQNIYVRYNLVITSASETELQLSGTGEMVYIPYRPPLQPQPRT
ncbi:MAG: hypothetical protein M9928_08920 [Anaerolineae bacterium]|nr:hypothetical protein [Anaerolineae bacterium]MCO5190077.1 hypothetical protein [Anaerolineae bacterium]MCO5195158.1 hypothetical protein [Anaerolineae bacterium]MCO5196776.1 hypothetical protein [Anaerolineae bacterium]MCO5205140.1 hypothetical protein [Anaerolineae bacterium]